VAQLEELESPVSRVVEFPQMRLNVVTALADLADRDYQERAWIRLDPRPHELSNLDTAIHILYDDFIVLPNPEEAVGSILLPGDEVDYLRELGKVLDVLIDRYGDSPDAVYMADDLWEDVMKWSRLALAAMVRSWGFEIKDA
jgi:hypothetical protein